MPHLSPMLWFFMMILFILFLMFMISVFWWNQLLEYKLSFKKMKVNKNEWIW